MSLRSNGARARQASVRGEDSIPTAADCARNFGDVSMALHQLARQLEQRHGADDEWAKSIRKSADFMAVQGKLYLRSQERRKPANDV